MINAKLKLRIILSLIFILFITLFFYYYNNTNENSTIIEFKSKDIQNNGFYHYNEFYTNNNESITLEGNLTTNKSSEVKVTSSDDKILYSETFSNVDNENIIINLTNFKKNSYYTISFSSTDSSEGILILKCDKNLTESKERPIKSNETL